MTTSKTRVRIAPTRKEDLRAVDRAFIHSVMFGAGIVPIEDPKMDIRRALGQLTADESRVLKRKFRKLWRKYMKAESGKTNFKTNRVLGALGVGKRVPSRSEKLARKKLVYEQMWYNHIVPMLERFENPVSAPVAATEEVAHDGNA